MSFKGFLAGSRGTARSCVGLLWLLGVLLLSMTSPLEFIKFAGLGPESGVRCTHVRHSALELI